MIVPATGGLRARDGAPMDCAGQRDPEDAAVGRGHHDLLPLVGLPVADEIEYERDQLAIRGTAGGQRRERQVPDRFGAPRETGPRGGQPLL